MNCGLYRTGQALQGAEAEVQAGLLVHLHDHRPEEWPTVHLPQELQGTQWSFEQVGWQVLDAHFLMAMVPLPPEGWYVLRVAVATGAAESETLPARSLVLLGYNRHGDCLIYPSQFDQRGMRFATVAVRFANLDVLESLEPVNFDVPIDESQRIVH